MEMTISAVGRKDGFFLHSYLRVRYVPILGRLLFLYLTSKSVGYLFMDEISQFAPSSSGGMSGNSIPPNSDSTIFAAGARPGMRILAIKKQGKIFVKENTHIIYSYILNI